MENIIPLIQLDKVYGGLREDVVPLDDYIFDFILGKYAECKTLTQLLFDTDSGFLQSLEWREEHHNVVIDLKGGSLDYKDYYHSRDRQYHAMILAQMTSDDERIQYLLNNITNERI